MLDQGDVASSLPARRRLSKDKAAAAIFLKPDGKTLCARRHDWSSRISRHACRRSPRKDRTPSTRARSPTPSSRRARPRAAFWPRRISSNMRCASCKPVECNYRGYDDRLLAAAELRRRHHLRNPQRAGGLSARLSRLRLGRNGACSWSRRCAMPMSTATPRSAIRISSTIRSRRCSTRPMPSKIREQIDPVQGRRVAGPEAAGFRRKQRDDALFDRRRRRQRGRRHLHAERLVRRRRRGAGHRHPAQQRDGRFHRQARRRPISTAWCRARPTRSRRRRRRCRR